MTVVKYLCFVFIFATFCRGSTLYTEEDHVTIVNSDTFKQMFATETKKDYLVQFFHSHCGHCISFAPKFKVFAKAIKDWKPLLEIVVIDCASKANIDTCSDAGIAGFPTVLFYAKGNKGINSTFDVEANINTMQNKIVDLVSMHSPTTVFKPIEDAAWAGGLPSKYVLLKGLNKMQSIKAILNYASSVSVPVLWSQASGDGAVSLTFINEEERSQIQMFSTWPEVNSELKKHLEGWHLWRSSTLAPMTQGVTTILDAPGETVLAINTSKVHYVDLQSTLTRVLFQEVPIMLDHGKGDKFTALQTFIDILCKYFPGTTSTMRSLQFLQKSLQMKSEISKSEWKSIANQSKFPQLHDVWVTCLGSEPHFRRYPCGLWTLFHSLTVAEWEAATSMESSSSIQVLPAMKTFIQQFFSCSQCAENFHRMSSTLEQEVHDVRGSVLWLWRSHNDANSRLAGELSEDPHNKKVQFPSKAQCPRCRLDEETESGEKPKIIWSEEEVLKFMKQHYSARNWVRDVAVIQDLESGVEEGFVKETGIQTAAQFSFMDLLFLVPSFGCFLLLILLFCLLFRRCRRRRRNARKLAQHEV